MREQSLREGVFTLTDYDTDIGEMGLKYRRWQCRSRSIGRSVRTHSNLAFCVPTYLSSTPGHLDKIRERVRWARLVKCHLSQLHNIFTLDT